jgi:hypothetical protein
MQERRALKRWFAPVALAVAVAGWTATQEANQAERGDAPHRPAGGPRTATVATASLQNGPGRFAPQVLRSASAAQINPQLLMAILYNEAYKPHNPALEKVWQHFSDDAALGVANMHKRTFDEVKKGHHFANREWEDLSDDHGLAIEAAAWQLRDLSNHLQEHRTSTDTADELIALGYNAGPTNMRKFARGAPPGPEAKSYLERLRQNWSIAGQALRSATESN